MLIINHKIYKIMRNLRKKFNTRLGFILGFVLTVMTVACLPHILIAAGVGLNLAALFVSVIIDQGSGKLGDTVISRNKAGNYIKRHKKPTNPNSIGQQGIRQWHQFLAKYWGATLTAAQRASFNDYAGTTPVTNKFGKSVLRSGFQWFIKRNPKWLVEITSNVISTCVNAPATFPVTTWSGTARAGSPDSISVTAQFQGSYPDNCYVVICASAPSSAGRAKPKTKKITTMTTLVSGDAIAIGNLYDAVYGGTTLAANAGKWIYFQFIAVDIVTGVKMETLTLTAQIQQNPT